MMAQWYNVLSVNLIWSLTLPVPYGRRCSVDIQSMFCRYSVAVLSMFGRCSVDVPSMFRRCSVDIPSMFRPCFVHVLSMFHRCSVDVLKYLSIWFIVIYLLFQSGRKFELLKGLFKQAANCFEVSVCHLGEALSPKTNVATWCRHDCHNKTCKNYDGDLKALLLHI